MAWNVTFNADSGMKATFGEVHEISTTDYERLSNKPRIEGVTLEGDKSFPDLGLDSITAQEIDKLIYGG